jgi:hypothetical protein
MKDGNDGLDFAVRKKDWRECRFVASSGDWLRVVRSRGEAAVEAVYRDTLEGRTRPEEGHVLSLWDAE